MNYDPEVDQKIRTAVYGLITREAVVSISDVPRGVLDRTFSTGERFFDDKDPLFETLNRSRDRARMHPSLRIASKRAHDAAVRWVIWARSTFTSLWSPYVVIPGNGDLTLEWAHGDRVVALNIHEEEGDLDAIFFRMGTEKDVVELNAKTLERLLNELLVYKESATPFQKLSGENDLIISEASERFAARAAAGSSHSVR